MTNRQLYSLIGFLFTLTLLHSFPVYLFVARFGPSSETPVDANVAVKLHDIERFADLHTIFAYNLTSGFMAYFNLIALELNFTIGLLVISWSYLKIRRKLKNHSRANPLSSIHHIENQINRIMMLQVSS
uniref:7TM_GPCR_Srx domain-containing protein n=1 Tax=Bursaphelenchus xylophilus TaxID=6326 RepID=A0A1I7RMG8_BURXY